MNVECLRKNCCAFNWSLCESLVHQQTATSGNLSWPKTSSLFGWFKIMQELWTPSSCGRVLMSIAPSDHSMLPGCFLLVPHRSISLFRSWFLVFPILSLSVAFWVWFIVVSSCYLSLNHWTLQAIHQAVVTGAREFLMAYPLSLRGDILFPQAAARCHSQN